MAIFATPYKYYNLFLLAGKGWQGKRGTMITVRNLHTVDLKPFGDVGLGAEVVDFKELAGSISAAIIKLGPSKAFKPHTHPSDHILVILKGSGVLSFMQPNQHLGVLLLSAGDVVPVPKDYVHAFASEDQGCEFLSIATPARALEDPERLVKV